MKNIDNIVVCHTAFSKGIGLRFHKKITKSAYVFPFDKPLRATIDMFFVHFSIDLIFLDKDKKVVEIKENFKPYRVYTPKNKFSFLVEVPVGYAEQNKLNVGKKLDF